MELFFTNKIIGSVATLDKDESKHCVKVLRHKVGDVINFIDGKGGFYKGTLSGTVAGECTIDIIEEKLDFSPRDYFLHMAVAPTKNIERYEWFLEKSTELGIDQLTPLVGEHSERKVFKPERGERILLSATKQSLKATLPLLDKMISVKEFIINSDRFDGIKLIAHCNAGERTSFVESLRDQNNKKISNRFLIMIGPEGDFSNSEVELAISHGFVPVTWENRD